MTVLLPVRKFIGHYLAVFFAMALVLPSLFLFCAVHKAFDKPKIAVVTEVISPIRSKAPGSYDSRGAVSLAHEQMLANMPAVAESLELKMGMWPDSSGYNDVYETHSTFWGDDSLISNSACWLGFCLSHPFLQGAFLFSTILGLYMARPIVFYKL